MSKQYEDYEQEYNDCIGRIQNVLASTRSVSALNESDVLLSTAKDCAHAMQALAEVDGDPLKIEKSKRRLREEISPLSKEISKSINECSSREILFGGGSQDNSSSGSGNSGGQFRDFFAESQDLLRESQSLCADSEALGTHTLGRMGMQREQLEITYDNVKQTINYTDRAGILLSEMRYRALKSKAFLYFIIGVLIIANGFALHHLVKK